MLWNYKTFNFSPKMRQMVYPDCKTTLKVSVCMVNITIIFHTLIQIKIGIYKCIDSIPLKLQGSLSRLTPSLLLSNILDYLKYKTLKVFFA